MVSNMTIIIYGPTINKGISLKIKICGLQIQCTIAFDVLTEGKVSVTSKS